MVLSAFPHQARHLLCLVGAEVGAPPGALSGTHPRSRSGELGLWYHYQITSIGPLGLGPAALTALLADAILARSGLADGAADLADGGLASNGLANGSLASGALADGQLASGDLTGSGLSDGGLAGSDLGGSGLGDNTLAGGHLDGADLAGGGADLAGGGPGSGRVLAGSGGPGSGPGGRTTVRHTTGVSPAAAGPAALSTVLYAKGRLTGPATDPPGPGTSTPGTGRPGPSGTSTPGIRQRGTWPAGAAGTPGPPGTGPAGAATPGLPGSSTPGPPRAAPHASQRAAWLADGAGTPGGDRYGGTVGHVVVLGADVAVARAAIGLGAERLTVVGAPPARAEALGAALAAGYSPARVRAADPGDLAEILAGADGLIQVATARTRPPMPAAAGLLRPGAWVADLVYRPVVAGVPRSASAPRPADGVACPAPPGHRDGMLAWQTVGAFRLAIGSGTDAERALRYLAAVTGTVAGNARAAPVRTARAR